MADAFVTGAAGTTVEQRTQAQWIRAVTLSGLIAALISMLIAAMAVARGGAGIVFVLGMGLAAGGALVGLLFSMPRALAVADDLRAGGRGRTSSPDDDAASAAAQPIYSLNTNLQEVSDWLTKIIVGLGLVEAQRLADFVWRASVTLGGELNDAQQTLDADSGTALALGIIVGFPLIGFLIGFFSVRLYISRAMRIADEETLRPVFTRETRRTINTEYQRKTAVPSQLAPDDAPAASLAVTAALSTPLERLTSKEDLVTRGRAAMLNGNFTEAASAFALALERGGRDPAVLLDYARTLEHQSPPPVNEIVTLLDEARRRLGPRPSPLRRQVMWELLNAYLYTPAPNGFSATIRLGDEYVATDGANDAYAYVYLAAAHGQAYAYWQTRDKERAHSEGLLAVEMARKALEAARRDDIEDGIRRWLQRLATQKTGDNDLYAVAEDFAELRSLLDLSPERERS